jgi:hypothetical protein
MSNNLVLVRQNAPLAKPDDNENWLLDYASSLSSGLSRYPLLRFIKRDWTLGTGDDKRDIPTGTEAVADATTAAEGWQSFRDGQPTGDQLFASAKHRLQLPVRSALGDNDSSQWELDLNGRPKDPWSYTRLMTFFVLGEPCAFVSQSAGGKSFLADIAGWHGNALRRGEIGKLPKFTLGASSYLHKKAGIGRVYVPAATFTGMVPAAPYLAMLDHENEAVEAPVVDQAVEEALEQHSAKPSRRGIAAAYDGDPPPPPPPGYAGPNIDDDIIF